MGTLEVVKGVTVVGVWVSPMLDMSSSRWEMKGVEPRTTLFSASDCRIENLEV